MPQHPSNARGARARRTLRPRLPHPPLPIVLGLSPPSDATRRRLRRLPARAPAALSKTLLFPKVLATCFHVVFWVVGMPQAVCLFACPLSSAFGADCEDVSGETLVSSLPKGAPEGVGHSSVRAQVVGMPQAVCLSRSLRRFFFSGGRMLPAI